MFHFRQKIDLLANLLIKNEWDLQTTLLLWPHANTINYYWLVVYHGKRTGKGAIIVTSG